MGELRQLANLRQRKIEASPNSGESDGPSGHDLSSTTIILVTWSVRERRGRKCDVHRDSRPMGSSPMGRSSLRKVLGRGERRRTGRHPWVIHPWAGLYRRLNGQVAHLTPCRPTLMQMLDVVLTPMGHSPMGSTQRRSQAVSYV